MSLAQLSGFILICLMIGIVYLTTRFVSEARYNGKGIYFLTINAWFRGNDEYRSWLRNNKVYHWCILLVIALCPTILLLIEPFRQNKMFVRPEASIFINIMLWFAVFKTYQWLFRKINERK